MGSQGAEGAQPSEEGAVIRGVDPLPPLGLFDVDGAPSEPSPGPPEEKQEKRPAMRRRRKTTREEP